MVGFGAQKCLDLFCEFRVDGLHLIYAVDFIEGEPRALFEGELIKKLLGKQNSVTITDPANLKFHPQIITKVITYCNLVITPRWGVVDKAVLRVGGGGGGCGF